MNGSRAEIHRKTYRLPALSFEDQQLTSFSGLIIFQALFAHLQLKRRLSGCFEHLCVAPIFGHKAFILGCIRATRAVVPRAMIETRMDSAFFSDEIVQMLEAEGVEYSTSVPFERFAKLKRLVERRRHRRRHNARVAYFERQWKPDKWQRRARFVFVR